MKRRLFIQGLLIFFLYCFLVSCKAGFSSGNDKYRIAFKYIKAKDFNSVKLHVVDTLIYLSQFHNCECVLGDNMKRDLRLIDSLDQLDSKYHFEKEFYDFSYLKSSRKALNNVYFSKPIHNSIMVEVVRNRGHVEYSYSDLTLFTSTTIYKFRFDSDNNIVDVKRSEVNYN